MNGHCKKLTFCGTDFEVPRSEDCDDHRIIRKRMQVVFKRPFRQEYLLETKERFLEVDCKELYRKTLQEVYRYDKKQIEKRKSNENVQIHCPQVNENKLIKFIINLTMEHETLVEIILLLPLTLMVFYIVVIEKGSLFQYIEEYIYSILITTKLLQDLRMFLCKL